MSSRSVTLMTMLMVNDRVMVSDGSLVHED